MEIGPSKPFILAQAFCNIVPFFIYNCTIIYFTYSYSFFISSELTLHVSNPLSEN